MKKVIGLTMLICIGLWAAHVENADVYQQRDLQTHSPAVRGIIHEKPQANPDATRDLLWDQAPSQYSNFHACQWDSTFTPTQFDPEVADNFELATDATIDSVVWWGGYWNPGAPGPPLDFWIKIYPDSGGGMGPQQTAIYVQRVAFVEHVISGDYHWYEASIPDFSATGGVTYWIVFQPTLIYPPQWGNNCDTLWGDGQEHYFRSVYFGFPTWVPATGLFGDPDESSFQLYGTPAGGGSTGGPDDFGYRWIDSDAPGGPTFNWIEISGTGTPTNAGDDDEIWPIPFPGFTFYGTTFDTVGISSNGAIYFEDLAYWPYSNYALPYGTYTDHFMALYWDDLNPAHANSDDIYWEVIGDQLVIEWNNIIHFGSPYDDTLKMEIILDRTNGDILFQYLRASSEQGSGATVGIQGDGTEPPAWYLQYSLDSVALHDNLAIRFYYEAPGHDVGCTAVNSPVGVLTPADYDVIGRIQNFGGASETFDATASVYDVTAGGSTQVFTQTITMTGFPVAGDSNVNFGTVTIEDDKTYLTEIYTLLSGDENPVNDTSTAYATTETVSGTVIYSLDATTPTGDVRLLGIEFDGTYFYLTGARDYDSCFVYVVDTAGTVLWTIPQPSGHHGTWGWRDLTWDGVYAGPDRIDTLYASDDYNVDKFGIDLTTGALTVYGSFAGPITPCRALAYDEHNDWYFTASFSSDCYKFNKTNSNIMSVPNPGYAFYGSAYDHVRRWVWWHSQDDPGTGFLCTISQMFPGSMDFTGLAFGFVPPGLTAGSAGGLCFWDTFRTTQQVLFAMVQGTPVDMIVGILLREYTGIEDEPGAGSPFVFGFAPNMANPVREQAVISYVTSTQGRVTLKVYDGAGRLVETLVNSVMPAGAKTVNWDVRNIANGVYFLRLEAESNSTTHKMILVK